MSRSQNRRNSRHDLMIPTSATRREDPGACAAQGALQGSARFAQKRQAGWAETEAHLLSRLAKNHYRCTCGDQASGAQGYSVKSTMTSAHQRSGSIGEKPININGADSRWPMCRKKDLDKNPMLLWQEQRVRPEFGTVSARPNHSSR